MYANYVGFVVTIPAKAGIGLPLRGGGSLGTHLFGVHKGLAMAFKSKLTKPPQWWKHLRDWKKVFWHAERRNAKRDIQQRLKE